MFKDMTLSYYGIYYLTPEVREKRAKKKKKHRGRQDSNLQSLVPKTNALPLGHDPLDIV